MLDLSRFDWGGKQRDVRRPFSGCSVFKHIRDFFVGQKCFSPCFRIFVPVAKFSSATPWTVAQQAPLSMGFSSKRILEWVAMPFSRGSSPPRDQTPISYTFCIASGFFTRATWEAQLGSEKCFIIGVGVPMIANVKSILQFRKQF